MRKTTIIKIAIIWILTAFPGLLFAIPPFNADSVRLWIEQYNPNNKIPALERIYISGPAQVTNIYTLNGMPAVRVNDSTGIVRYSKGLTALMLLRQLGLSEKTVEVFVYSADRPIDPVRVLPEALSKVQIKPHDVVHLVYRASAKPTTGM